MLRNSVSWEFAADSRSVSTERFFSALCKNTRGLSVRDFIGYPVFQRPDEIVEAHEQ